MFNIVSRSHGLLTLHYLTKRFCLSALTLKSDMYNIYNVFYEYIYIHVQGDLKFNIKTFR